MNHMQNLVCHPNLTADTTESNILFTHNINLRFNPHSLMCVSSNILIQKKDKKTKHMITIITITKKPNLINYNNAPLTKTQLIKIIKFKHSIEKKKIWRN